MRHFRLFIFTIAILLHKIGLTQTFYFNDTLFKVGSQKIIYSDLFCTDRFEHLCDFHEINKLFYDSIGQFLKQNRNVNIILRLYTSTDWDSAYSSAWTIRRSSIIRDRLVSDFGLDSNQIKAEGYGQKDPIIHRSEIDKMSMQGHKSNAHAINKRTLIIITKI